jgi:hypothetical protein
LTGKTFYHHGSPEDSAGLFFAPAALPNSLNDPPQEDGADGLERED